MADVVTAAFTLSLELGGVRVILTRSNTNGMEMICLANVVPVLLALVQQPTASIIGLLMGFVATASPTSIFPWWHPQKK